MELLEEITIRVKGKTTQVMAKRVNLVDWLETFFNTEEFVTNEEFVTKERSGDQRILEKRRDDKKTTETLTLKEKLEKKLISITIDENARGKLVKVTEKRTGMSIGSGNNQTEAKARAINKINELGKEPFLAMVGANEL